MKTVITTLLLSLLLGLTACTGVSTRLETPAPSSPQAEKTIALAPTPDMPPLLKTAAGDFAIASARLVDEVNGAKAGPAEKILLVILTLPGKARLEPASFSLETFEKALRNLPNGEVHLTGSDGSYTICSMAGWVGEKYTDFAMGFRVPTNVETFQLFWPGNAPIDIQPES